MSDSTTSDDFPALVVRDTDDGPSAAIERLTDADLPDGDVTVDVEYSSLNYKDGLALTGRGRIIRSFPMVPGIDLAGTVAASENPDVAVGDRVVLNGYGVGERHWGGYAGRARVRGDWLVPLPEALSTHDAMAIGTAGYTAMLCVLALEDGGVTPGSGPVLVTGAAGGVGSVAVAVLAGLGHEVVAVTGRPEQHEYLRALGASGFRSRDEMSRDPKPLEAETWAGAVDTVGSTMLARVLAETRYGGTVAATGLAGGPDLPTTVMPFILRNVRLQGVDSVMAPRERRVSAWERLATDLPLDRLASMTELVSLREVVDLAPQILAGRVRGRVVVDPRR